jgi:pimeloyl-ACP methyl ester carboxylesterase
MGLYILLVVCYLISCAKIKEEPHMDQMFHGEASPINLHFSVLGHGPPLLLIHGFGANTYTWSKVSKELSSRYTVISVDLKGHGCSPKPLDDEYSLYHHASLITQLILAKDLHNLTIVGHSLGGAIALLSSVKLKRHSHDALRALILIDPIAYQQKLPTFMKLMRTPYLGYLLIHALPERLQAQMILNLVYHDRTKISKETIEAYAVPLQNTGAKEALLSTARYIVPPDIDKVTSLYPTINEPTLVLWGEHDNIVPYAVAERLSRALPQGRLVRIPRSGHAPQEELPAETLSEMLSFLDIVYDHPKDIETGRH